MDLYGYYSETQKVNNNTYYIYLDENGKNVIVSEVSRNLLENTTEYFSDNKYVGKVTEFVKNVKLSPYEINNLLFKYDTDLN